MDDSSVQVFVLYEMLIKAMLMYNEIGLQTTP